MPIHVLEKQIVDLIAAGEVVERPASVVKELVENAIDAGAGSVTCEIKNGGIDLIRVTDNGCGIPKNEIRTAFLRHATSKIEKEADLDGIRTLGFRGEALSSIAAVSQLEVISRTADALTGVSLSIDGGEESGFQEIGAPAGTTFLVRNLFYNTPARRKFLKTAITEGSYVSDLMERFALSHPDISFRLIVNGNQKLATSGNGKLPDLIYTVYGRESAREILTLDDQRDSIRIKGCIGKPVLAKGSRSFENYFVNGRYVKSELIARAIEEAYQPYMMLHRYPLTVLYIELPPEDFDVNVHPTKMELRFRHEATVYDAVLAILRDALKQREFIPDVQLTEEKQTEEKTYRAPEPFESRREEQYLNSLQESARKSVPPVLGEKTEEYRTGADRRQEETADQKPVPQEPTADRKPVQQELFSEAFLSESGRKKHRLIGQLFETYWLIQMDDKLYIMDQHAAHEKVLYERKMKELAERKHSSQLISPPVVVSLTMREELLLNRYTDAFIELGYEIASFGGRDYAISAVPADLYGLDVKALFREILGDLESELDRGTPESILSKLASMSCKAAVKGNTAMSFREADALIEELMGLDNPYACPHGRPTLVALSRQEIEKKFKRIV